MVAQVLLRNTIDAWVSPERSSRFGDTRLYVHSTANAYVYFTRPRLPEGSIVTSARFRIRPGGGDAGGAATVNLHLLTASFDPSSLTWGSLPSVGAQVASLARASWLDGNTVMEFNVASEIQRIVDGGAWFGWRISTTKADATQYLHSGQSTSPLELVIEYSAPPQAPIDLYPFGNRKVTDPKPTLSWTTPGGATSTQVSVQVQVATNATFTTGLYTSDEIASGASSLDLDQATPAFTAIPTGSSRWFRVRIKNDYGSWSPWSAGSQFTYETPYVVNITAPGSSTSDPTPTVTWTYTGTQVARQALVYEASPLEGLPERLIWDSGVVNDAVKSFDVPEGVVAYSNRSYRVVVRVWEQGATISTTGAPSWWEDNQAWNWVPSGAQPPVELHVTPWMPRRPGRLIRWRYTGPTPLRFIVVRTRDGVTDMFHVQRASSQEGGTEWYRYVDFPNGRSEITYQVLTVLGDGSVTPWAEAAIEVVQVDYKMPWVLSEHDPANRQFCLVNATIDPGLSEVSDVVVPVGGAPYLAQWSLQKFQGTASGLLSGDVIPDIMSAQTMKSNFLWIRQNPRVKFFFQDEAITCFIYNTAYTPVGRSDGGTDYAVSFNFVQE